MRLVPNAYAGDGFHPPNTGLGYPYDPHVLPYADCALPGEAQLPRFRASLGGRPDGFTDDAGLHGVVYGGGGGDLLITPAGVAYGGRGGDALSGRVAFGGAGDDEVGNVDLGGVKPSGAPQRLHGGRGADDVEGAGLLNGDSGDDQLLGVGTLIGGSGADVFGDSPLPLGRRLIRARDRQYDIVECPERGGRGDTLLLDGRDYIGLPCLSARILRSRAPRAIARFASHVYRDRGWRVFVLCPADVAGSCTGQIELRSPGTDTPVSFHARPGAFSAALRIGNLPYCRAAGTRRLMITVRSHDASGIWRSATRALDARPSEVPRPCRA